jgi:hypothetical protein
MEGKFTIYERKDETKVVINNHIIEVNRFHYLCKTIFVTEHGGP